MLECVFLSLEACRAVNNLAIDNVITRNHQNPIKDISIAQMAFEALKYTTTTMQPDKAITYLYRINNFRYKLSP